MPCSGLNFLAGVRVSSYRILYGNMVDFSFIVSLYVSELLNVTISRSRYGTVELLVQVQYEYGTVVRVRVLVWMRFGFLPSAGHVRNIIYYSHG